MSDEFKFEIVKELGSLGSSSKGWSKELNLVKWGENKPKADIRSWSEGHAKMGKGITLSKDELKKLKEILNEIDFNSF